MDVSQVLSTVLLTAYLYSAANRIFIELDREPSHTGCLESWTGHWPDVLLHKKKASISLFLPLTHTHAHK